MRPSFVSKSPDTCENEQRVASGFNLYWKSERHERASERKSERANARTVRTRSSELVNRSFANSESEREEES